MYDEKDCTRQELAAQVVMDVLEDLPPMERITVAARYCDGYEVAYIAELFNMSMNRVRNAH
ncbi:MAG: hypothetical protein IJW18_01805 [Lachnospiraceae bacterium]|nr:hypothetical protein [Lachnospiraceae bacterium]